MSICVYHNHPKSSQISLINFKKIVKVFLERRGNNCLDSIGITKITKENFKNDFKIYCVRPYILNDYKEEIIKIFKDFNNINLTILESDLWLDL